MQSNYQVSYLCGCRPAITLDIFFEIMFLRMVPTGADPRGMWGMHPPPTAIFDNVLDE